MPTGVYVRKRKAVTSTVKPLIKGKKSSKRMTLTIYANNSNTGGMDIHTFKIHSYGEMIDILYERFAGIHINEVRCV